MKVSQTGFQQAVLNPDADVPDGLRDGQGRAAGRRFAVYRNNVVASLTEALELSFPAIAKLIGEQNFRILAGSFLRQNLPETPMLFEYGAGFPAFLSRFEPLAHVPYLPDVARLEHAIRLAYHAADSTAADPAILQTLSPEALTNTRFVLAPPVRLLRSAWPVHAIWAYNLEDGPKPAARAENVLITRPGFDPELTVVSDGAAECIAALHSGHTLGEANEAASSVDAAFDLTPTLSLLLGAGAITDFRMEPPS